MPPTLTQSVTTGLPMLASYTDYCQIVEAKAKCLLCFRFLCLDYFQPQPSSCRDKPCSWNPQSARAAARMVGHAAPVCKPVHASVSPPPPPPPPPKRKKAAPATFSFSIWWTWGVMTEACSQTNWTNSASKPAQLLNGPASMHRESKQKQWVIT